MKVGFEGVKVTFQGEYEYGLNNLLMDWRLIIVYSLLHNRKIDESSIFFKLIPTKLRLI